MCPALGSSLLGAVLQKPDIFEYRVRTCAPIADLLRTRQVQSAKGQQDIMPSEQIDARDLCNV